MANGELCRTCRKQETDHELYPEETCVSFKSEVRHKRNCPVIGCNGDCAAFMAEQDEEARRTARRLTQAWFLDGPNLILLDIGT